MKRFNIYPVNHQEGNKIESEDGVFVKYEDLSQAFIKCIQDICETDPADTDSPETISISITDLSSIIQQSFGLD